MKSKLIIVAGCSGSGKTTVSNGILKSLKKGNAQIICMDRFYKKTAALMPKTEKSGNPNFDHPDSIDWPLLRKCIKSLINGKSTKLPIYDYVNHKRIKKTNLAKPAKVIILEGVLALLDTELNELAHLKVFVDTHVNECFARRFKRDQVERGRSTESIVLQWTESVKPMYDKYVKPNRWVADFILPWNKKNDKSLQYLVRIIKLSVNRS